jgi:hypothetical protein
VDVGVLLAVGVGVKAGAGVNLAAERAITGAELMA